MENLRSLRVVVASPGDVQAERELLADVVIPELNHGIAADRGIRLDVYRWETDAYPRFHAAGPQGAIDEVLQIGECDLLVGIFWTRFGTPTGRIKSGTEHEIRQAIAARSGKSRPEIMIYFNQAPYTPPSPKEMKSWKSVLDFQRKLSKEGLWWAYVGAADFERNVRKHLTRWILKNFRAARGRYDYYDHDLALIDAFWDLGTVLSPETVFLVTGCHPVAELLDRPVAELLKTEIDQRGRPPSKRRGIIVGDWWWKQDEPLRRHPVISIGGSGSNSLTNDLLPHREHSNYKGYLWWLGESFPEAVIAGGIASETMQFAKRFIDSEDGLTSFLRRCWP
jgi:hypothetical protein